MQEEKGENVLLSNEKHLNLSSHKCWAICISIISIKFYLIWFSKSLTSSMAGMDLRKLEKHQLEPGSPRQVGNGDKPVTSLFLKNNRNEFIYKTEIDSQT